MEWEIILSSWSKQDKSQMQLSSRGSWPRINTSALLLHTTGNQEGSVPYQRTMPSPTALKRSLVFGFMGMTCWQSGSFSRALFIQLTKAYFSSSVGKWSLAKWRFEINATIHSELRFLYPREMFQGYSVCSLLSAVHWLLKISQTTLETDTDLCSFWDINYADLEPNNYIKYVYI